MPDEATIKAAEQAQTRALVDAHATELEQSNLLFSSCAGVGMKLSFTLTDLAERIEREERGEDLPPLEYEPDMLAEVAARVRLRLKLELPRRDCAARIRPSEASHCLCLSETLDALIESGEERTRAQVVKTARQAHRQRWAWLKRRPKPQPVPIPATKPEPVLPRAPIPAPAALSETPTKPFRRIRHTQRWYDPPTRDIRDMQF
jgi:hypothetical protein